MLENAPRLGFAGCFFTASFSLFLCPLHFLQTRSLVEGNIYMEPLFLQERLVSAALPE